MQMRHARAIRANDGVVDAMAVRAGLEQHRAGAVAEQHAGGAVRVVDDRRHLVGADHHDLARLTGTDELRRDGQRIDEARTGRLHIEAADVADSHHVADDVGGGGKHEIRRRGRADQEIDVLRSRRGPLQQAAHRFSRHVRGAEPLPFQDPSLLDAGALGDPGVAGIDHARERLVVEHVGGEVAVYARDGSLDRGLSGHIMPSWIVYKRMV